MKKAHSFESQLYQGRYREILLDSIDSKHGTFQKCDLPYIIGALCFRGRLSEAAFLYQQNISQLSEEDLIRSNFFLSVNLCRKKNYTKAREYVVKNLQLRNKELSGQSMFFIWQSLGFFHNSLGKVEFAHKSIHHAYLCALESNFLYGKVLATDLLAHIQVFLGQASLALKCFREAQDYAKLLGDGGVLQAIQVSKSIHSAQHGFHPESDVEDLLSLCETISSQDNYSLSRLYLELSRQHLLRGRANESITVLNEACRLIYGEQNPWYSIRLHLRYAQAHFAMGDHGQALNLLRSAKNELDVKTDKFLEFETLSLEKKMSTEVETLLFSSQQEQRLSSLTKTFAKQHYPGDDPLGDLVDISFSNQREQQRKVVKSGFFGLLLNSLPINSWDEAICFDLIPGSVVVINKGNIYYHETGSTSIMKAIVKQLCGATTTKEQLIKRIWGYDYDPLRHDSLVYRNISRFRSLLEPTAPWLVLSESGYQLKPGVQSFFFQSEDAKIENIVAEIATEPMEELTKPQDLKDFQTSPRQMKILNFLKLNQYIDIQTSRSLSNVSEVTARRDLSNLYKQGFIRRLGKGRATCYTSVDS